MSPNPTHKLNSLISYKTHEVAADGHCFYRALYNVMREAEVDSQEYFGLDGVNDEEEGVEMIRGILSDGIKNRSDKLYNGSRDALDALCQHVNDVSKRSEEATRAAKEEMRTFLNEMYPLLTAELINASGPSRYNLAADLIMEPLYASSIEVEQVNKILALPEMALLIISDNGGKDKWERDLQLLLSNSTAENVMIFVNIDNIHYNYMTIKLAGDSKFRTIVKKTEILDMLRPVPHMGGGKKKVRSKAK